MQGLMHFYYRSTVEESKPYRGALSKNKVDTIQLITPTTPDYRMKKIVNYASGFVYCVSRRCNRNAG